MVRFMTASFVALGWVFYEMSGGAGFAPPEAVAAPQLAHAYPEGARAPIGAAEAAPAAAAPAPAPVEPAGRRVVTRPSEFGPRAAASSAPRPTPRPTAERDAAPAPAVERRTVAGSRVNMRGGPGTRHRVTHVLSRGEVAEILAVEGGWARIRSDGREGWMALSLLTPAD